MYTGDRLESGPSVHGPASRPPRDQRIGPPVFFQSNPGHPPTNRRLQTPAQPHAISHDAAANPGLTEGTINV